MVVLNQFYSFTEETNLLSFISHAKIMVKKPIKTAQFFLSILEIAQCSMPIVVEKFAANSCFAIVSLTYISLNFVHKTKLIDCNLPSV